jgi:hypothetical protein
MIYGQLFGFRELNRDVSELLEGVPRLTEENNMDIIASVVTSPWQLNVIGGQYIGRDVMKASLLR